MHDNKDTKIEGDIYISIPTARDNADKYNEPYEKEVARLVIHGVLHLIGFYDDTIKGKDIMSKIEDRLLKETKWADFKEEFDYLEHPEKKEKKDKPLIITK